MKAGVATYLGEVALGQHYVHAYAPTISEFKNLHVWVLNDRQVEHPLLIHHGNRFPRTLEIKSHKHVNEPNLFHLFTRDERKNDFSFHSLAPVGFSWQVSDSGWVGAHLSGNSTHFDCPSCVTLGRSRHLSVPPRPICITSVTTVSTAQDHCKGCES